MLVGSAFNPGREIEPVALLECMAHGTSCTGTSKLNLCLQLFNLNSFRPAGSELPRGSSWTVSKRSEWTTAPLNSIKAASFVFIKQENESSTNPHVGPLKMQVKTARFSKFRPIKENSEGILMMLWVVVSSEVVHLLLWLDNPWLRTHRLREKQKIERNLLGVGHLKCHRFCFSLTSPKLIKTP